MDNSLLPLARFLANAINPALVVLQFCAPFWDRKIGERSRFGRAFAVRLGSNGLALAIAIPLAEIGKRDVVWAGHPYFPSGHMTFATTTGVCVLACASLPRRAAAFTFPLVGLMGWSLVRARFHEPVDIAGALILGGGVGTAVMALTYRSFLRAKNQDTSV